MASVKVETGRTKNIRGRAIGHYARFAGISCDGTSIPDALAKLKEAMVSACTFESPSVEKFGPYVIIVCRTILGYESKVIRPDTADGTRHSCVMGSDMEGMRQSALLGICQELWTKDGCTELYDKVYAAMNEKNQREMVSWAAWQTRYQELVAEGKSPTEAHRLASGY